MMLIEDKTMILKKVLLSDLTFDPNNVRKHSKKNLNAIIGSLQKFGQVKPIVVQNNVVVAGNGTLEAAIALNWKDIEIIELPSNWSVDKVKAYAIADNRTAELAEWDINLLSQELLDLENKNWDLMDLGFSKIELDKDKEINTNSQIIKERYEVVIECDNENNQMSLLLRFVNEGLKVRAITI